MTNKVPFRFKGLLGSLLLTLTILPAGIFADTLTIKGYYWPGEMDPELENRLFLDDLIGPGVNSGFGFGRYNLAWNKGNETAPSLGLEYARPFQQGKIIAAVSQRRHYPEYSYVGFDRSPNISLVSLDDYRITNTDYELGYEVNAVKNIFYITPRVGIRNHYKTFEMNDTTFGGNTYVFTMQGPFEADVYGSYLGADAKFFITQNLAVNGGYFRSSPIIGNVKGDMTFDFQRIGISGNTIFFQVDKASANYEMEMTKLFLGGEFFINNELSLQFGWMSEEMRHRYTNYINIPIVIVNNSINMNAVIGEMITDMVFYNQWETMRKSMLYAGVTYAIKL